jgi:cold shock CspA family protein
VLKFNDKGYDLIKFLENSEIFFHFSQIKSEEIKKSLIDERGDFFLYFISNKMKKGKEKW